VKRWTSVRAVAVVLPAAFLVLAVQPALAQQAALKTVAAPARCSPGLRSIALSPGSVPGGASTTATVVLTCAASKAQSVTLSGFPGTLFPRKLRVAAGKTEMSVTISTETRRHAAHGWITGKLGKTSRRVHLTIGVTPKTCKSPQLSGVSLPNLVYVGAHADLTVKLSCPSASAVRLSLASSGNPSSAPAIPAPAAVRVGAYFRTATFVLTPKAYLPGQYSARVSVHHGGRTLSRTITVDPGLSEFGNSPDSCSPNDVNLYLFFTGNVPAGGLTVKLRSSNAAVTVPATVTFTQQGSPGGGIAGVTVRSVSQNTRVTLTATLGSRTLTVPVLLLAAWQAGDTITLVPSPGPGPFYGPSYGYEYLVYLSNPAPAGGLTGTATTADPGDVQEVSSAVNVAPGCQNTEVSFSVPYESAPVHTTVTVSLGGSTATVALTIEPSLATVTIPSTITGGQAATGTVTLAGAPDAPETVYLQALDGIMTVPGSVTIPAGQTSVTFPITTVAVTSDSQVSVEAWHSVSDQLADSISSNSAEVVP
jgi:hypothetical protein